MSAERSEILSNHEVVTTLPVIAVVGHPGAGKETACEILAKTFGIKSFTVSSVLRELAVAAGLNEPFSRDVLRKIHREAIAQYGQAVFVNTIVGRSIKTGSEPPIGGIAIDGPRYKFEVEAVRAFPNGVVIGILADELIRYERVRHRGRPGDVQYLSQFRALEAEEGNGISEAMNGSDILIRNEDSINALEEALVSQLKQKRIF